MDEVRVMGFASYKVFLRALIEANRSVRAFQTKLAEAAGCRVSYLSRVINGDAHLTPEHAVGIADFLTMPFVEAEYFYELVNLDRAGSPALRSRIEKRLAKLQTEDSGFPGLSDARLSNEADLAIYYSHWLFPALHMAAAIKSLATPDRFAERFNLPEAEISRALKQLEAMGMVKCVGGKWSRAVNSTHLPRTHPYRVVAHTDWRAKAISDIQLNREGSLHYTGLHAMEKKDMVALKELFMKAITKSQKLAESSGDEDVMAVTVDIFRV